jgi:hypothetical protein
MVGEVAHSPDREGSPEDQDEAWKAASVDALRLYHGFGFTTHGLSGSRTRSAVNDKDPAAPRRVGEGARTGRADAEAHDGRRVASEIASWEDVSSDAGEGSVGSLQASSDTLSVSRFNEGKSAKKGCKRRKRRGLRRRGTVRGAHQDGGSRA